MGLLTNLTNYYKLNGNANYSVGVNNGIDFYGATYATGKIGLGASFSGSNQWIELPYSSRYSIGTSDYAYSIWFKRAGSLGTRQYVLGQCDTLANDTTIGGIWVELTAANKVRFRVGFGGTALSPSYIIDSAITITDTNWHHVVISRTSGVFTMYIDNVSQGTFTNAASVTNTTWPISIGRLGRYAPSLYLNGMVDEFGFWQRGLSVAEVNQLYNRGYGLTYPFSNANFFRMF